jgi:fatty-acyl-CoA synthase
MARYDGVSVGRLLEDGVESVPDKIALVDGDQRKTYRQLNDMADALAASLSELGFKKGDRVGIYMKNSLEFVVAFYALQKLGVIVAWVSPNYRTTESRFILSNSEAKGVFVFREWGGFDYLESLLGMKEELPGLESVFVVGSGSGDGVYSFHDLVEKGSGKGFPAPDIDPEKDLALLIYTSGTTGNPKGAMITHYQAVRAGWEYALTVNATPEDVFIGFLPMCHSYGCGAILIEPFLLQSRLVLMEQFSPEKAFQIIEKEKITLQLAAPAHYLLEVNHPKRQDYDLSSVRAGLIAGQPAPEGLISRVEKEMGIYLTSFWGASEVGPGMGIRCPYPTPLDIREQHIGVPIEGVTVRVVDLETREEVSDGEIGELTLAGWPMLKGYWKNEEETRKQIVDGWLFMGDLVSREKNGFFKIYGRNKDLINRGGFKIYPHGLESLIGEHPKVEQVCVVATPNPVLGESICACVIPNAGRKVSLAEIREFLAGKVASYKLPDELCIMEDFPRLSGGVKINKFGKGGLTELALKAENREIYRKK